MQRTSPMHPDVNRTAVADTAQEVNHLRLHFAYRNQSGMDSEHE